MVNETQVYVGTCVCVFVLFISCLLFGLSWSVLDPLEAGLDQNTFQKTIDEERVYDGGRYMLGLGHSFIKYPRKLIIIDFSSDKEEGGAALDAGTKDGQPISIEVTLYYSLDTKQLPTLYKRFAENYQEKFVRIAQSTLKNTAVQFQTIEYFSKREDIANAMLRAVSAEFKTVYANVELLQLRGIGLASGFERRLTDNVIATQEQFKAEFDKQVAIVQAQTDVILARAQGNITQILGRARANSTLISETARAEGTKLIVNIERDAYGDLKRDLGLSNSELNQYLWATRKLRLAAAKDTLLVGFGDDTRINVGTTAGGGASAPQSANA